MSVRVPAGLITVAEALKHDERTYYNVMGVCTDYLQPTQSRGTDLTMKLHIWDLSCADGPAGLARHGMQVRIFAPSLDRCPCPEGPGDIFIMRNLKNKLYGSDKFALSNHETTWTIIFGSSLSESTACDFFDARYKVYEDRDVKPTLAEFTYAKQLLAAKDPSSLSGPAKSTTLDVTSVIVASGGQAPTYKAKFRLFKDLDAPTSGSGRLNFVDLLGEVVKVYDNTSNVEVKITDYTEHPLLYPYTKGDDDHSGYPIGRMTMNITCWDEHAEYVRTAARSGGLMLGMYMQLRNVQVKLDRNGAVIEGYLRGGNSNFGCGISIYRAKEGSDQHPQFKGLLQRRREYRMAQNPSAAAGTVLGKREAVEKHSEGDAKKKSKAARKQERIREVSREKAKRKAEKVEYGQTRLATNQHVRCENIDVSLTNISEILAGEMLGRKTSAGHSYYLPFQNVKYKTRMRVYDYFPDNLQDFCVPVPDYHGEEGSSITPSQTQSQPTEWEWQFFLLVGDINADTDKNVPLMTVQICGQDADYLLNAEAKDLRRDTRALRQVKEKLFVLWGDLQEKKDETMKSGEELRKEGVVVSSRPFEGFIREFGVGVKTRDGTVLDNRWERMFAMFGTRIC